MSIVKFGPLITGARGTIAGTIFTANKSGPYARGWNRGPNPRSTAQSEQRGRTSGMAKAWRGLTQAQRDLWDVWAAAPAQEKFNSLGESYFASGFNWFVAINDRLLNMGRATRTTPPGLARPAAPPILAVLFFETPNPLPSTVTYVGGTFAGFDMVLFAALSNSIGVITKTQGWRLVHQTQAPGGAAEPFQVGLEANFGTVSLTQRGFIRIARQTTDGVRSSFTTAYADVI
jgi:hypothetical protein